MLYSDVADSDRVTLRECAGGDGTRDQIARGGSFK
jgi:hypothetical protein